MLIAQTKTVPIDGNFIELSGLPKEGTYAS